VKGVAGFGFVLPHWCASRTDRAPGETRFEVRGTRFELGARGELNVVAGSGVVLPHPSGSRTDGHRLRVLSVILD
jgi:hypothetical protein